MNSRFRTSVTLMAAGAISLGALAVAAPSLAHGRGPSGPASSVSDIVRTDARVNANVGTGTVDDSGAAALALLTGEEKLALDLYQAFADAYPGSTFEKIVRSEKRHLDAMRNLMSAYGLNDPTANLEAGRFADPRQQDLYDSFLAQGMTSLDEAYLVGLAVETDDIAVLDEIGSVFPNALDVQQTLGQLKSASERHLAAFNGTAGMGGSHGEGATSKSKNAHGRGGKGMHVEGSGLAGGNGNGMHDRGHGMTNSGGRGAGR